MSTVVIVGASLWSQQSGPVSNPVPPKTEQPGGSQTPLRANPGASPTFVLSEMEQKDLQIITLRRQLYQVQLDKAAEEIGNALAAYVDKTLKAHGNPPGVTFDQQKWQFVMPPSPPASTSNPQPVQDSKVEKKPK